jgi:hypothetical protein
MRFGGGEGIGPGRRRQPLRPDADGESQADKPAGTDNGPKETSPEDVEKSTQTENETTELET